MNLNNQKMEIEEMKNIKLVRRLAKELIEISSIKQEKYPFREEYMDKLLKKMMLNHGKFLIDLDDLPDRCILNFNDAGKNLLNNLLSFIKDKYGLDKTNRRYNVNFYLISDSINKGHGGLSVGTLKKYIKFLSDQELNIFDMKEIKKTIIKLKASNKSKAIVIGGLPIDLRDEKWSLIFGIIPDSHLKRFKFVAEDKEFAEQIKFAFRNVGMDPYFREDKNLIKIKGHSIVGHIVNIAGIETNKKQLVANNCLPLWMFSCSKKYHAILLSKFLDTEGHVSKNKGMIRIAQASFIDLTKEEKDFVLSNCKMTMIKPSKKESKVLIFSKLNENLKEKVLLNPSLILLSTQLLLRKYGINSKMYPLCVYISCNGIASISWHLSIMGFRDIRNFYDFCGKYVSIDYKRDSIKRILDRQKCNFLPMGLRILNFLINAYHLEKKKGYFTSRDLMELTKRKIKTINTDIGYVASQNLIKTVNIDDHLKFWNLTEKGRDYLEKNFGIDKERWDELIAAYPKPNILVP